MVLAERHRALEFLDGNRAAWGVKSTPPDREHYPHTFLWDGAFVAIVRAHYGDAPQAAVEITEILSGQKENGMVPNMKFGPGRKFDFERPTFLNPKESSDYSQPPLLAHATWDTAQKLGNIEGKKFIQEVYPRLAEYYDYFDHTRTDPGSSLIAVIHPHETGRDSDPTFDFSKPLRIPQPEKGRFIVRGVVDKANTAIDYISALGINMRHRMRNWDVKRAREVFWVKDVMFNVLYSQNLDYMSKLADHAGFAQDTHDYRMRAQQVEQDILTHMWDEWGTQPAFYAINKDQNMIREVSVSNLFPVLLPNIPVEKLEPILDMLESPDWFGTPFPIPSVAVNSRKFDGSFTERRLWRGPTWTNMNLLITLGLLGQRDRFVKSDPSLAMRLNADALGIAVPSLELIKEGYRESNNPHTGEGQRVHNFAWATVVHLLEDRIPEMMEFRKKMSALD